MKRWLFALILLFGMASLAAGVLWWQQALRQPLSLPESGILYQLEPGSGLGRVLIELQQQGVIAQPLALKIYARLNGRGERIQAGEYRLQPGVTPLQLLAMFERGDVIRYSLTLVEGWTVRQTLAALRAAPALKQTLGDISPDQLPAVMNLPDQRSPEGLFFPDTYQYRRGTTDRQLLMQAYQRMADVLNTEWQQRAVGLPYNDSYEALIMASIIERETGVPNERDTIAGVFVRRLIKGMRLQTDPTVIYGLGAQFDGNLRSRHLRDASNRYNTYRHAGLPPTPIALPGRAAIHAALHPADGDALYFVARGDGTHIFSATLAEHQSAVRRYQLQRRADYRSHPPSEEVP